MPTRTPLADYMAAQVHEMELSKWYEGERTGKDPGSAYLLSWVEISAAAFRAEWERTHGRLDCAPGKPEDK